MSEPGDLSMTDNEAWLYLFSDGPYTKIGVGDCPERRRKQWQGGNPRKIQIEHQFRYPDRRSAYAKEAEFKRKWHRWRTRGGVEWFKLPPGEIAASIPLLHFTPPEVITPGEALLSATIQSGFDLTDRTLRAIKKIMPVRAEVFAEIRGVLLEAMFEAHDAEKDIISRAIPEIGVILEREFDAARRAMSTSPRYEGCRSMFDGVSELAPEN